MLFPFLQLCFYHDEPRCRPYHTFYGDLHCPKPNGLLKCIFLPTLDSSNCFDHS
jgi:hypothetical protein